MDDNHTTDGQIQSIRREVAAGDYSELGKLAVLECRSGEHVWQGWEKLTQRHTMNRMALHQEISKRFFGEGYQRTNDHIRLMKRECFWCGTVERFYSIELYCGTEKRKVEVRL